LVASLNTVSFALFLISATDMFAYAEKRESTEAVQRSIRRNEWQKTNIRERWESRAGRAEETGWTVTPGIYF